MATMARKGVHVRKRGRLTDGSFKRVVGGGTRSWLPRNGWRPIQKLIRTDRARRLFIAQRLHRIDPRRPAGRDIGGDYRNHAQYYGRTDARHSVPRRDAE